MRLPLFALLFAAALLGTAVALRLSTTVRSTDGIGFATALSAGTAALWMVVIISAFEVVSVSGGSEISNSYPGLAVLGVIGVGVSIAIAGKGALELLGER